MTKLLLLYGGSFIFTALRLGLFGYNNTIVVPNQSDHIHYKGSLLCDRYVMCDNNENKVYIKNEYFYDQHRFDVETDTIISFRPVKVILNKNGSPVKIVDKR